MTAVTPSEMTTSPPPPHHFDHETASAVIESMADAVLLVGRDGRIQRVNRAAATLFAAPVDEMEGIALERLLPPASVERHAARVGAFHATGERSRAMNTRHAVQAVRADGSTFPCQVSIGSLGPDSPDFAVVRDITELEHERLALAQREQRYWLLFEYAAEGIVELDDDGTVTAANAAARAMFAAGDVRLDDVRPCVDDLLPPRSAPPPVRRHEHQLLRRDGSRFWASVIVQPSLDSGGHPSGLRLRLVDVTARVEAQAMLARSEALLRAVLDDSPNAVLVIDAADWRISYENTAARHLYGSALLTGHFGPETMTALSSEHDRARIDAAFERAVGERRRSGLRLPVTHPDWESTRVVDLSISPLERGTPGLELVLRSVEFGAN